MWEWAATRGEDPDVVLACAGDIPTMETLAAAWLLRRHVPDLRGALRQRRRPDAPVPGRRPSARHGRDRVQRPLHAATDVVFAFHGYARGLHELVHGRRDPDRFHVRGFSEQGTTTTPFDMVVLNRISRYHLCKRRSAGPGGRPTAPTSSCDHCDEMLARHQFYVRRALEDMPEIRDWTWSPE